MDEEIFKYRIPKKILAKFPDDFWGVFHRELTKIFGVDYTDNPGDALTWLSGTSGWYDAFKETCKKLRLNKVLKYYDELEWYDSDLFNDELCSLLIRRIKV